MTSWQKIVTSLCMPSPDVIIEEEIISGTYYWWIMLERKWHKAHCSQHIYSLHHLNGCRMENGHHHSINIIHHNVYIELAGWHYINVKSYNKSTSEKNLILFSWANSAQTSGTDGLSTSGILTLSIDSPRPSTRAMCGQVLVYTKQKPMESLGFEFSITSVKPHHATGWSALERSLQAYLFHCFIGPATKYNFIWQFRTKSWYQKLFDETLIRAPFEGASSFVTMEKIEFCSLYIYKQPQSKMSVPCIDYICMDIILVQTVAGHEEGRSCAKWFNQKNIMDIAEQL